MKMGVIVRKIEWEGKDSRNGGVQYKTVQYNTVQCNTVQCNTIQYNTNGAIQFNSIPTRYKYSKSSNLIRPATLTPSTP